MAELRPQRPPINLDPRVEAGLRRLRAMGLVTHAYMLDEDHLVVLIDEISIINYIIKVAQKAITYPQKLVSYDQHKRVIRVDIWRGERRVRGDEALDNT